MSGALMSRTRKTTSSGTTLTSLGRMRRGTTVCRQQCPILALTLAPLLALPIAAVAIPLRRSRGRGWPEDVIAKAKDTISTTTIDQHRFCHRRHCRRRCRGCRHHHALTLSPLPPLSLSLQPPPTSLHLQCSCRWLIVVLSVAPRLLRCPPSKFVSPPHRVVVDADDDRYRRHRQLPSPLPQSTTTTDKSRWLSFVVNGGDDDHRLSMVGCSIVCRPLPAASSAVQICQPPPLCGALSTLFPLGRHPLSLAIASRCPATLLPSINCLRRSR